MLRCHRNPIPKPRPAKVSAFFIPSLEGYADRRGVCQNPPQRPYCPLSPFAPSTPIFNSQFSIFNSQPPPFFDPSSIPLRSFFETLTTPTKSPLYLKSTKQTENQPVNPQPTSSPIFNFHLSIFNSRFPSAPAIPF